MADILDSGYIELTDDVIDALPDDESRSDSVFWPEGYALNAKGLFHISDGDKPPTKLSGPFTVLGLARDQSGDGWSIALEWMDRDSVVHRHYVALSDLIGDGNEAVRPLVSGGLKLSPHADRLKRFKAALAQIDCRDRVRLVRRSGWHGDVFVLPHATMGRVTGESVVYDGRADAARYAESGTLEEWIENVAWPASGNSRLILSICLAFAGPLADLLSDEGGGVHLVGA